MEALTLELPCKPPCCQLHRTLGIGTGRALVTPEFLPIHVMVVSARDVGCREVARHSRASQRTIAHVGSMPVAQFFHAVDLQPTQILTSGPACYAAAITITSCILYGSRLPGSLALSLSPRRVSSTALHQTVRSWPQIGPAAETDTKSPHVCSTATAPSARADQH